MYTGPLSLQFSLAVKECKPTKLKLVLESRYPGGPAKLTVDGGGFIIDLLLCKFESASRCEQGRLPSRGKHSEQSGIGINNN